MSLFQVREWWGTKSEHDADEYTYGGLVLGNVDNDPTGHTKIVTGSLKGILRVYYPIHNEFKIEHLLLEENLHHPILQLSLGYFIPNQRILALAVLHPKRVCIYVIEGVGGNGLTASYFRLTLRYEHRLGIDGNHFTAYNMIHGCFGSTTGQGHSGKETQGRDHLCVQSLDGRLQFFEQDRFAFLQALNHALVPGALCYVPPMDAIITSTADLQIECYRYQVLASASLKQKKGKLEEEEKSTKSSLIHSDWKVNVGETITEIRIGRVIKQENTTMWEIIALGEFTLFHINAHGELTFQKRLGYHPSTFCLYRRALDATSLENIMIASHSKLWAVYREQTLIWSAWASNVPIAMQVANIGGMDGMIVAMDAEGALSVNYMGTDPPSTSVVAVSDTKEVNYEEMDEEHRQLLNVIRRAQGERRTEPKERVLVRAQVPSILDVTSDRNDFTSKNENHGVQLTMRIYVTFTGSSTLSNVTLSILPPDNILVSQSSIVIDSINGQSSTPLMIPIILRPNPSVMPTSLELVVGVAYTLETGQPRVSQIRVKLPMCLAARLVPPVKASTFKFTLETNQEPLELTNVFQEMFHQPFCTPEWAKTVVGGTGTNVMSFQYYNGIEATILVSKNAGRYRIQSSELEALWLVSHELIQRLTSAFKESSPFEIFYQEPLPLADFFSMIDSHFTLRKEKLEIMNDINDRAHQFRVIQKRLLVRYKDRNPSSIQCLDVLLHGTYEQLITLSHRMEETQEKLQIASNRLSCCISLILMLIQYRFHLDDENTMILAQYLSPQVNDHDHQGWEERTDAAMTELLRTLLAKQPSTSKDTVMVNTELELPEDTKKLKKHITIVCDRLGKGAMLIENNHSEGREEK